MALLYDPQPFTQKSKQRATTELLAKTAPDSEYYVLLVGSALLAIGAIFTDSIPVLIASMIVAPLANPILALGLGLAAGSLHLVLRSSALLFLSCAAALGTAYLATLWFGAVHVPNYAISFAGNAHISFIIALVSGAIAAYGTVRPKVASAATGLAIAVSLMPPLVATGIELAPNQSTMSQAPVIFLLNVVGILISSAIVFACFGMGRVYKRSK